MSYCWYCYWGWAIPVVATYKKYVNIFGGYSDIMERLAHVVWEDENFDDNSIKWNIEHLLSNTAEFIKDGYSLKDILTVKQSLEELLMIPETERDIEPQEYKDKRDINNVFPKDFPSLYKTEHPVI